VIYSKYVAKNYSKREDWRTLLAENLFYQDQNLVNLSKVCKKRKKFNGKKLKLEPSFRRQYESPSESEDSSGVSGLESDLSDGQSL